MDYPVVIVPSHGARPVISISDGPHVDGKPKGINAGTVYIRSAGPESVAIRNVDDWYNLLDRCLSFRTDMLSRLFRQSIDRTSRPALPVQDMLKEVMDDASADFVRQTDLLMANIADKDAEHREAAARGKSAHAVIGYALIDDAGTPLPFQRLRHLAEQADVFMGQYASYGWQSFLVLHPEERAPQIRPAVVGGKETQYLEGMRLEHTGLIAGSYDYWRMYEDGFAVSVESYVEDAARAQPRSGTPYILVNWALVRLHSILAHARYLGALLGPPNQLVVRMTWKGLEGRRLQRSQDRFMSPGLFTGDRFTKTITVPWTDLRDDHFGALKRLALPFFDIFPNAGWGDPESWLTKELVDQQFREIDRNRLRLPEPDSLEGR